MRTGGTIRVLIVDDSLLFRQVIARGITSDPAIEVVAMAVDPFDARDQILEHHPDLMICDIEMPKMNGIEFLKRLIPQYPLPVIVVSSISSAVFDALSAGAVDFIAKPPMNKVNRMELFIEELIDKAKAVARAKVVAPSQQSAAKEPAPVEPQDTRSRVELIAVGASTGGTEAIASLLRALPPVLPGIVIVQHIPATFSTMFAERLNNSLPLRVKEAATGDVIEPGTVLIAPGDRHMRVKRSGTRYTVSCTEGERVNGHCPSVDVLFESVAKEVGDKAVGVILTGMGYDGTRGLLAMRRRGASTIGQDERSSVVYGMPKAAYEAGAVEKQAALSQIPRLLLGML